MSNLYRIRHFFIFLFYEQKLWVLFLFFGVGSSFLELASDYDIAFDSSSDFCCFCLVAQQLFVKDVVDNVHHPVYIEHHYLPT